MWDDSLLFWLLLFLVLFFFFSLIFSGRYGSCPAVLPVERFAYRPSRVDRVEQILEQQK